VRIVKVIRVQIMDMRVVFKIVPPPATLVAVYGRVTGGLRNTDHIDGKIVICRKRVCNLLNRLLRKAVETGESEVAPVIAMSMQMAIWVFQFERSEELFE